MLAHPRPILTQSLRLRTLRLALRDSHSETLALRDTRTLRQGLVQFVVEGVQLGGVPQILSRLSLFLSDTVATFGWR